MAPSTAALASAAGSCTTLISAAPQGPHTRVVSLGRSAVGAATTAVEAAVAAAAAAAVVDAGSAAAVVVVVVSVGGPLRKTRAASTKCEHFPQITLPQRRQWCLRKVTVKGAAQSIQASTFWSSTQCRLEPRGRRRRRRLRLGQEEGSTDDGRRPPVAPPSVLSSWCGEGLLIKKLPLGMVAVVKRIGWGVNSEFIVEATTPRGKRNTYCCCS